MLNLNFIFPQMMIVIMIVFFALIKSNPMPRGKPVQNWFPSRTWRNLQQHLVQLVLLVVQRWKRMTRPCRGMMSVWKMQLPRFHPEWTCPLKTFCLFIGGKWKTPDGKRCDLWEVFSIPRLGPVIRKMGGQSLRSYDLAHYWDLSEDRYMRLMIQDIGLLKPKFIFLSPPCRYLSPLMHSNWPRMRNYQKKIMSLTEGLHHLDLSMWGAGFQISQGALFALEHPDASLAWSRKSVTLLCFVFYFVTLRYHVFWCWFGENPKLEFLNN